MSRVLRTVAEIFFVAALCVAFWPGNVSAQEIDTSIDPETWVYESVIKDGELQFKTFGEWLDTQSKEYRPFTVFVDSKLGCKPPIDAIRMDNLSSDWFWRLTGAPLDMLLIDGQYVVAHGYAFKNATTKSLMILDIVNRWAAFAMTHSKDHWNHEDGAPRYGEKYSERYQQKYNDYYFSLFLTDPSSDVFIQDAKLIARKWFEGYGIGGKPGLGEPDVFRVYLDDEPMGVYEVRCGVAD